MKIEQNYLEEKRNRMREQIEMNQKILEKQNIIDNI